MANMDITRGNPAAMLCIGALVLAVDCFGAPEPVDLKFYRNVYLESAAVASRAQGGLALLLGAILVMIGALAPYLAARLTLSSAEISAMVSLALAVVVVAATRTAGLVFLHGHQDERSTREGLLNFSDFLLNLITVLPVGWRLPVAAAVHLVLAVVCGAPFLFLLSRMSASEVSLVAAASLVVTAGFFFMSIGLTLKALLALRFSLSRPV